MHKQVPHTLKRVWEGAGKQTSRDTGLCRKRTRERACRESRPLVWGCLSNRKKKSGSHTGPAAPEQTGVSQTGDSISVQSGWLLGRQQEP